MPKKNRHSLKSKYAKKLLLTISKNLQINIEKFFESKIRIELLETEIAEIFIFNGRPLIARFDGCLFPTLYFKEVFGIIPKLVVDMGAVPFICKGADLMAPGVLSIKGQFNQNELLLIIDERHGKPLAIGLSIFDSEEMKKVNRGKIAKNLHFVGDKLWDYLKEL